jgi:ribonuclease P protein component
MSTFSLSHNERLKSRKQISLIFSEGRTVKAFPLRLHYIISPLEENQPLMNVGFVIPKRNCKLAVDRNRYKRRIFEAVRLNRMQFMKTLKEKELHIDIMIVYIHRDEPTYNYVAKAIKKGLEKLENNI